jgi:transposase InsO family protein
LLHNKNDVFKIFKTKVEKQCEKQIKIVRSNRGREYYSRYTEDRQVLGVEKQCEKQIKIVRSNRGGEYYSRYTEDGQVLGPFSKFLQENRMVAQYTMPGSPYQNGVAEKKTQNIFGHGTEYV